ncbi:MAG: enoyl-CoA hydratase/isomerase family protein [Paracoccaceae bacterium]
MCTITLNRPEKANSLTSAMLETLVAAVETSSAKAKVLVLAGTGNVFSAGADLDEARTGLATSPLWERLSGAVAQSPCLTIAALNGTVAGGAIGMVLACDLRVSVPGAKFFYPVMRLGFLPQPSDPKRLSALIGPARAKMILMAGQKIGADEALSWGLVDRLAEPEHLMQAVSELAHDALAASPAHIAAIKAMVGTLSRPDQ